MTYVAYYQCDKCGRRLDTDLSPEGWTTDADHEDICPSCSRAAARPNSEDK